MCGRFTLRTPATKLREYFPLFNLATLEPRFNIAPTQSILAFLQDASKTPPHLARLRWGLIPSWAEDKSIGAKLLNARAETLATKPAFRVAFRRRRCLILADGFYEWKKAGRQKLPYHIRFKDGRPFAFAGLWEHWTDPETKDTPEPTTIESCTIVTTTANEVLQPLHERMPVILPPAAYATWLDPSDQDLALLQELLQPHPAEAMTAVAVSQHVNNARHEDADCLREEPGLF